MSAPAVDLQAVQAQVSPGNPHRHEFTCESPPTSKAWGSPGRFVVHRPSRTRTGAIHVYRTAGFNAAGYNDRVAAVMLNDVDGRYIEIESWLTYMLDEAPACWWAVGLDGKPLTGDQKAVHFDKVYNEDLDAVWKHVAPYLRSFGIHLPIPDAPTTTQDT